MSKGGLANFATLDAGSACDNVLLEHVLALEQFKRGKVRVMRGEKELFTGPIHTLKRFKDNVDVVRSGMDCGIRVDGYDDFQEGDLIQSVTAEQVAATL